MTKKLQIQIEKKLEKLNDLLTKNDALAIDSADSETWDLDALYSLIEELKESLQLLEDQKSKRTDEYGDPIILEAGICSLVEEYQSEHKSHGTNN